jgi:predicted short-subunit dehydrogenase-like oxidoreductase (DUF2520 family)
MYLLIGSGKAARHFKYYLDLLKIPNASWSRNTSNTKDIDQKILIEDLQNYSRILLLISDSSLESFYQQNLKSFPGPIIHFSGALEIEGMVSAHPLMTFGPELYELDVYKKMQFALSDGRTLAELLPGLTNSSFKISRSDKALYHAWAVYSGNLATLLWSEALNGMDGLHVPRKALEIYLEQTLKNTIQSKSAALTGPIARNDQITIRKNLNSLPEPARSIYQEFVQSYLPNFLPEVNL